MNATRDLEGYRGRLPALFERHEAPFALSSCGRAWIATREQIVRHWIAATS
jgi:hypothetical protein